MKSGCHHYQIGMDYLWDAIFKMAAIEINEITFSPITQFLSNNCIIDREKILMSKPMWMRNPMRTMTNPMTLG